MNRTLYAIAICLLITAPLTAQDALSIDTEGRIWVTLPGSAPLPLETVVVPVGTINAYGGTADPAGWMICDGRALSSVDYPKLFAVIGTSFGNGSRDGNGNLTNDPNLDFNLPDMRGRFARGLDTTDTRQEPRDPDRATRVVGSFQDDAFQGHWHGHDFELVTGGSIAPGSRYAGGNVGEVRDPINDGVNGEPRTSSETRPDNVAVNYIINHGEFEQ